MPRGPMGLLRHSATRPATDHGQDKQDRVQRRRVPSVVLLSATLSLGAIGGCVSGPEVQPMAGPAQTSIGAAVAAMNREAISLQGQIKTRMAGDFLSAVAHLPGVVPRRVADRSVDEWGYYYGENAGASASPIFYAHLLELCAQDGGERSALIGRRVLDLHGRSIGAARILAGAGADAVSVLSDPAQHLLYSQPGDQGAVPIYGRDVAGRVQLFFAAPPGDASSFAAVGGGYDVVFSRNVLMRGLIHPTEAVDPKTQLSLGTTDEDYLRRLWGLLKPGGRLIVYNLCPAPAPIGQAYNPYADCRSPFSQAQWQAAGFRVRDFDRSDTPTVRGIAKTLGWDRADLGARAIDVENNLFAQYTLAERP